jgi:hypothetical protein
VGTSWGLRRGNRWHEVAAIGTKWLVKRSYTLVTSEADHLFAKVRVAGSNPVVRSQKKCWWIAIFGAVLGPCLARLPTVCPWLAHGPMVCGSGRYLTGWLRYLPDTLKTRPRCGEQFRGAHGFGLRVGDGLSVVPLGRAIRYGGRVLYRRPNPSRYSPKRGTADGWLDADGLGGHSSNG